MAAWPSTLPDPQVEGHGVDPLDPVLRTEMDGGNIKTRRTSLAESDMVPVSWKLSDAQMDIFRAWFRSPTGANGGAGWFDINLPLGNGGAEQVEARFAKGWSGRLRTAKLDWLVTAQLEVRYA